jgi:hypothetical protein
MSGHPFSIDDPRGDMISAVIADGGWIDLACDAVWSDNAAHEIAFDAMNSRDTIGRLIDELTESAIDKKPCTPGRIAAEAARRILVKLAHIGEELAVAIDAEVDVRLAGW